MNLEKSKDMEYQRFTSLLAELIDLDTDTEKRIYKCFQSMGINNFLLHLELIGLPQEISEKLTSIKSIIEMSDGERGQA